MAGAALGRRPVRDRGATGCRRSPPRRPTTGCARRSRFTSYVADVKLLQPGESAGYGRRFIATEPTWIGLVPAGYADGVPRLLSGQGDVLVRGRRRRVAATISMDQLTFVIGPELRCRARRHRHSDRALTGTRP